MEANTTLTIDINEIILDWLMYIAGTLIYILAVKIPSWKRRGKSQNRPFNFREWIMDDGRMLIVNVLIAFMATLGWDALVKVSPVFSDIKLVIFGLIGLGGNPLVFAYASKFGLKELEVINVKSNVSDLITNNKATDVQGIIDSAQRALPNVDVVNVQPMQDGNPQ